MFFQIFLTTKTCKQYLQKCFLFFHFVLLHIYLLTQSWQGGRGGLKYSGGVDLKKKRDNAIIFLLQTLIYF